MTVRHQKAIKLISVIGILAFLIMLGAAMWLNLAHREEEPVPTSIAISKPAAPREVASIVTDDLGNLIITYSDGSTQNAGRVKGDNGKDGQVPSTAQLSTAVYEYCQDGRCDAKKPTQEDILLALSVYCGKNGCKGVDAQPVTAEQISVAVANYCSDGRCKGAAGSNGATGATGAAGQNADSTIINCVVRTTNNIATNYVAWKYSLEANTAYRNIYKLPVWATCDNQIDLRST